ncbi:3D (Asp-Asp-Asp) domain-containing protein [Terribacillus halophilus]|uniref:3D (Asp-Asp-Asp) domain-containing protein n=1 Tax=Terribacillus halophilus TaxID=361279 RepID=A0A1G6I0M7_9BACI|nr:3D domain-containing protein [Terribacillus halophilus]SDC00011.1 3D (Asp-Asp-Asp) domain-containing protein [Terribacillus halophilus]
MKKTVVSLATGLVIAGAFGTSASAAEYNVQKGDSLWKIADKYEVSVNQLKELNQLDSDLIFPNQKLTIDKETNQADTYTVQKGDSLYKIAGKFNVSVGELKAWNSLNSDLIVIGQQLAVTGGAVAEAAPVKQEAPKQEAVQQETTQEEAPKQEEKQEAPAQTEQKAEPAKQEAAPAKEEDTATSTSQEATKELTVSATAYTGQCEGCSGVTATGIDLNANPNAKVIAVDPNVIPLGSKVWVEGYGEAIAGDTGGAIKGNKIDVHVPDQGTALDWGRKSVTVKVLD